VKESRKPEEIKPEIKKNKDGVEEITLNVGPSDKPGRFVPGKPDAVVLDDGRKIIVITNVYVKS
jgi:hypothetical protein